MNKNQCIDAKRSHLLRFNDYEQKIIGAVSVQTISEDEVKCSFKKQVFQNGETKNYDAYLVLKQKNDSWFIISESDELTDKNLSKSNTNNSSIPSNAVQGDFDGDGKNEFMWIEKPKISDGDMNCEGDCNCYIVFSNSNLPKIKVEYCIGGDPINEGDLNNDGADEIGLLPTWFTSCWRDYSVWTYRSGRWKEAVESISTHCNQWELGIHPIEKDKNNPDFVIIHYSEMTEDDIVVNTKKVKVR